MSESDSTEGVIVQEGVPFIQPGRKAYLVVPHTYFNIDPLLLPTKTLFVLFTNLYSLHLLPTLLSPD
jgi:hypothetical protein